MAQTSAKNMLAPTSPASVDLGLGDQLKQQVDAQVEERRKKLLQNAKQASAAMSPASLALGFPGGPNA